MYNSDFHCTGLKDFPIPVAYAAGGIVDDIPIICGGANGTINRDNSTEIIDYVSKDCYEFKERGWSIMTKKMLNERKYNFGTGNLVIKNQLLVHGGQGQQNNFVNSSEMVGLKTQSSNYTLPVSGHCNIMINEKSFMVTGGTIPDGKGGMQVTNKTYYCQTDLKKCIPGPPLFHPRRAHGCYQKWPYLYVVGGYIATNIYNSTDEVEYLNLEDLERHWTPGTYC